MANYSSNYAIPPPPPPHPAVVDIYGEDAELSALTSSFCRGVEKMHRVLLEMSDRDYENFKRCKCWCANRGGGLRTGGDHNNYNNDGVVPSSYYVNPIEAHKKVNDILRRGRFYDIAREEGDDDEGLFSSAQSRIYGSAAVSTVQDDVPTEGKEEEEEEEEEEDEEEEETYNGHLMLEKTDPILGGTNHGERIHGRFVKTLIEDSRTTFYEAVACYGQSTSVGSGEEEECIDWWPSSPFHGRRHWRHSDKKERTHVA